MTASPSPYEMLPAIHRIRDSERGEPLRGLLAVVEEEWRRLVEDVDDLYDDWFIETCDEWVVPYIADLLGVQGLTSVTGGPSLRAVVANTLAYRRRKGTPAVLEQLARDVTGWPARVVEYFSLIGTIQHLDHVRLANVRTPDLRDSAALELVGTPFDRTSRTVDVRHIDIGRGRHNIPNVGLHMWRLGSYAVAGVDARAVDRSLGQWKFDPAGRDMPLFIRPRTKPALTHIAEQADVPDPLRRRALYDELTALAAGGDPVLLAEPTPALRVRLDGAAGEPVGPSGLVCCDLTDWQGPRGDSVAVDPMLGRIALPTDSRPARVLVDYAYGFPGDLGAGPYDRRETLAIAQAATGLPWPDEAAWRSESGWQIGVGRDVDLIPGQVVRTIGDAVRLWNARPPRPGGQVGVIAVSDSATYTEDLSIDVSAGDRLLLVAAAWPEREPGVLAPTGLRPHLIGTIEVTGGSGASHGAPSQFLLDGFSVEGGLTVLPGDLGGLVVSSCTLLDGTVDKGMLVAQGNPQLRVRLLRSLCTAVELRDTAGLGLTDCIVHAGGDASGHAIDAPSTHVEVIASTVLGYTTARSFAASNAILRGQVDIERRQQGCVRFSFLPLQSRSPRRYQCQPSDEASTIAPVFTSLRPDDPGFGQLAAGCPVEISEGADDQGEMGAYGFLQQHRRRANLASQLDTYLRFGLEAGFFLVT
jgi:hypothetical protein